ncbi:Hypothetical predicted protein [Mytilus galloprovincialis]|uniref:Tyr recombinase domain-containing protein n=1 Tax=Mytilus galloprovincialis TaxID=29158 RepID=A0A8B6C2J0_MYTGA|nr:Hypothetical predicted protein [Mytilus galloprovincialis]
MYLGKVQITQERVDRLLLSIVKILDGVSKGKILYRAKLGCLYCRTNYFNASCFWKSGKIKEQGILYQCIVLRASSWKSLVALTAPAVGELRYWSNSVNDLNSMGVNLHESDLYDLKAYTDASEIGFGGFVVPAIDSNSAESVCDSSDVQMNSSLITPRNSLHTVVGSWADHERIKSSTWRELEAVNRTVKSSLHLLKNQTLQINTDNKNVTTIVKNGSRKTELQVLACLNIEQFVHEAVEDSGIEERHSLHNLVKSLSTRLLDARSESTDKKYYYGFMKWKIFCIEHSLLSLPASPIHIALYFVHLLDNGGTFSTVNTAFYSVKWAHEICGQLDPTSNTFVQNLLESAKRTAKKPVNKNDPVSKDILIYLCSMYQYSNDLTVVRDLVMILLSFSAFLRFSELSQLKCNDVTIKESYLVLKLGRVRPTSIELEMRCWYQRGSL